MRHAIYEVVAASVGGHLEDDRGSYRATLISPVDGVRIIVVEVRKILGSLDCDLRLGDLTQIICNKTSNNRGVVYRYTTAMCAVGRKRQIEMLSEHS